MIFDNIFHNGQEISLSHKAGFLYAIIKAERKFKTMEQKYRWDFLGLSTETKPTTANENVTDGSTYFEVNTSKMYVWYKDQWYEIFPAE